MQTGNEYYNKEVNYIAWRGLAGDKSMEKERGERGQRVKVGLTGKDWKGRSRQQQEQREPGERSQEEPGDTAGTERHAGPGAALAATPSETGSHGAFVRKADI